VIPNHSGLKARTLGQFRKLIIAISVMGRASEVFAGEMVIAGVGLTRVVGGSGVTERLRGRRKGHGKIFASVLASKMTNRIPFFVLSETETRIRQPSLYCL